QIRTGQRQRISIDHQEDIGKNRQGLPAFDDTRHQLQGLQQGFALDGKLHGLPSTSCRLAICLAHTQVVSVRSSFLSYSRISASVSRSSAIFRVACSTVV